ncbi:MAG: aspartate/glutamate racemase family protein [Pseudomonadota bacterium]
MAGHILIINPNINPAVTAGIDEAVAPLRINTGPTIEVVSLPQGPFGIEAQADIEAVTLPLRNYVAGRADADAAIIACFSDPGLAVCREAVDRPVYGIGECAMVTALTRGEAFGIIAMSAASRTRQAKAVRAMGIGARWAGSVPLGLSVADAAEDRAFDQVLAAGEALLQKDADVIILGCAGLSKHRVMLEALLGVPVLDPVQCAATFAVGAIALSSAEPAPALEPRQRPRWAV